METKRYWLNECPKFNGVNWNLLIQEELDETKLAHIKCCTYSIIGKSIVTKKSLFGLIKRKYYLYTLNKYNGKTNI